MARILNTLFFAVLCLLGIQGFAADGPFEISIAPSPQRTDLEILAMTPGAPGDLPQLVLRRTGGTAGVTPWELTLESLDSGTCWRRSGTISMDPGQTAGILDLPRDSFSGFPDEARITALFQLGGQVAVTQARFLSKPDCEKLEKWQVFFEFKPVTMSFSGSTSTVHVTMVNPKWYEITVGVAFRFKSSTKHTKETTNMQSHSLLPGPTHYQFIFTADASAYLYRRGYDKIDILTTRTGAVRVTDRTGIVWSSEDSFDVGTGPDLPDQDPRTWGNPLPEGPTPCAESPENAGTRERNCTKVLVTWSGEGEGALKAVVLSP
jgi:hypothetical protein